MGRPRLAQPVAAPVGGRHRENSPTTTPRASRSRERLQAPRVFRGALEGSADPECHGRLAQNVPRAYGHAVRTCTLGTSRGPPTPNDCAGTLLPAAARLELVLRSGRGNQKPACDELMGSASSVRVSRPSALSRHSWRLLASRGLSDRFRRPVMTSIRGYWPAMTLRVTRARMGSAERASKMSRVHAPILRQSGLSCAILSLRSISAKTI